MFSVDIFLGCLVRCYVKKIQPLIASGLQVVMRAMSTFEFELVALDSLTLSILQKWRWDLRTIDLANHGQHIKEPFKNTNNVEA